MVSFFFAILLPQIVNIEYKEIPFKEYLTKVIIMYGLFVLFFYGLQIYTLSDFFAFFLCMLSVYSIKKIVQGKLLWAVLFGATIYGMYNVRTIYVFSSVFLVGWLLYQMLKCKMELKTNLGMIAGVVTGCLSTMIPQIYMNYRNMGVLSAAIPTNNLMLQQLKWGLTYQRYATYVGEDPGVKPSLIFVDNVGLNILSGENLSTIWEYFHLILKYPFEMLSIYIRHFINMLFPVWPSVYIKNLNNNKVVLSIFAFSIFFVFVVAWLFNCIKRNTIWEFVPALIPVACITPGAVENRFFLALYIFVFCVLIYNIDWKNLIAIYRRNRIKIVVCYVSIYCILLSIWTSTMASLSVENPIFML